MNPLNIARYIAYALTALSFASLFVNASASGILSSSLCGIINTIRTIVGVLSLMLFVLGGALYAIAHIMPAAGNIRGNMQGWALGMVVGGIVGLIIVVLAPYIIDAIISVSAGSPGGSILAPKC